MNRDFNTNLHREPKGTAPYCLNKLEAGLCLEICGCGKDQKGIFQSSSCNDGTILYLNSPLWQPLVMVAIEHLKSIVSEILDNSKQNFEQI